MNSIRRGALNIVQFACVRMDFLFKNKNPRGTQTDRILLNWAKPPRQPITTLLLGHTVGGHTAVPLLLCGTSSFHPTSSGHTITTVVGAHSVCVLPELLWHSGQLGQATCSSEGGGQLWALCCAPKQILTVDTTTTYATEEGGAAQRGQPAGGPACCCWWWPAPAHHCWGWVGTQLLRGPFHSPGQANDACLLSLSVANYSWVSHMCAAWAWHSMGL